MIQGDCLKWELLMCTIPHRHHSLVILLEELNRQIMPMYLGKVGMRVFRDNLENDYGHKVQRLVDTSPAEFVSCFDDDDWPAGDFISSVMDVLSLDAHVDYVGFPVTYIRNGELSLPVEHSLRHNGWIDENERLLRDFAHFNPIRREVAQMGAWEGGDGADRRWADRVRNQASKAVLREYWIERPMYTYRENTEDTFKTVRKPLPLPLPAIPSYPWITEIH